MSYISPPDHTIGRSLWIWHKESVDGVTERDELVQFCLGNKINYVLLSLFDWIWVYGWTAENVANLQVLVSTLKTHGISVFGIGGGTDWTTKQNRTKRHILEPLRQYNAQSEALQQIDAFIFDVEYFVPDNDPTEHVPLMCNLMKDAKSILNMPIGLWAPWWQITGDRSTGLVEYDGIIAPEGIHWMRVADHVFVGCYSNMAESSGSQMGQIAMIEDWLVYANQSSRRMGVWVTSETANISALWQTYYGLSKTYMEGEHHKIADWYNVESNTGSTCFLGQSIHHYDSYKAMS